MDDGRLQINVTHSDGRVSRWSYDEVDSGRVPNDLQFGSVAPGGHGTMSTSLFRDLDPRTDEHLYDRVTVTGPGGQVAYEGRLMQFPRQTGQGFSVEPGGVGMSSVLDDFGGFTEVYIDSSFNSWGDVPIERQATVAPLGFGPGVLQVSTDTNGIVFTTSNESVQQNALVEAWYSAPPGCKVAAIIYDWSRLEGDWSQMEAPTIFAGDDITGTGFVGTPIATQGAGSPVIIAEKGWKTFPAARYAMLRVRNLATGNTNLGLSGQYRFSQLALVGDHGLPYSIGSATTAAGIYASDIIDDVVERCAPQLKRAITPTTYRIPHVVFDQPTTATEVISTVNQYHVFNWGVGDDDTFTFGPWGTGTEWQARIADGAQLNLEGDTGDQIINGVLVPYVDQGIAKVAGPPGSGFDVESASLVNTDPAHPANVWGLKRWKSLPNQLTTNNDGAVLIGAAYLAEQNLATRRGTMTLTGEVRHPLEGKVPVWRVRAGDTIILTDRPDDPARRILSASYSHASRSVTLELDSTSHRLDALLARWGVANG